MAAKIILKMKQLLRQDTTDDLLCLRLLPVLADLVVLAIDTPHVAIAEKDGPGSPGS
ncbi:MAG: hypothetical protein HYU64_19660 [Armatimonadetes bacterium]|nr:hypothetical protein [Armatimonadota bacterium]